MRRPPYRNLLPCFFALTSIALMAASIHEDQACIGYDAGRPFWPCETPNYLLAILNIPPIALVQLLLSAWSSAPLYLNYAVALPLILLWWRFVGRRLDFGLVPSSFYSKRRTAAVLSISLAALLTSLLIRSVIRDIAFHRKFSTPGYVSLLKIFPLDAWLLALILAAVIAALRLRRNVAPTVPEPRMTSREKLAAAIFFVTYASVVAGILRHQRILEARREQQFDLQSQIVRGRILDDVGPAVYAIKVTLVPLNKAESTYLQDVTDFTNKDGRYELRPDQPGNYVLAVQWKGAPYRSEPFLPRFYPDSANEKEAEVLHILPALHLGLRDMRLRRLPLQKVAMDVFWSTGEPAPDAYIFIHNTMFPGEASIGFEALHPDEDGTITLPSNFDYDANAQIDCDEGDRIDNHYGSPVRLSTKPARPPGQPIRLILPGAPCKVWHAAR